MYVWIDGGFGKISVPVILLNLQSVAFAKIEVTHRDSNNPIVNPNMNVSQICYLKLFKQILIFLK
jgi:hypothetical protein